MLLVAMFNSHDSASDIRMDVIATAITCRITMREMIDLNRITLFLGDEISAAAEGLDLHLGALVGKLLAQAMDIDFDGVRSDLSGKPEDMVLDLLLRHHAPLAAHQKFEHRGFARRQYLRLVVDRRLAITQIKFQIGDVKRTSKQLTWPAQLGFEPGDQFLQRERFDQIVTGTTAQGAEAAPHSGARGERL